MTVTANATDNVGVAGVQFLLDNNPLVAEDTTAPYSTILNTTTLANGTHTLTALRPRRRRQRHHLGTRHHHRQQRGYLPACRHHHRSDRQPSPAPSPSPPMPPTMPGWPACNSTSTTTPSAAEDTTAPYSATLNTTTLTNGTHNLTAIARDINGNTTTSAPVTITVANAAAARRRLCR